MFVIKKYICPDAVKVKFPLNKRPESPVVGLEKTSDIIMGYTKYIELIEEFIENRNVVPGSVTDEMDTLWKPVRYRCKMSLLYHVSPFHPEALHFSFH